MSHVGPHRVPALAARSRTTLDQQALEQWGESFGHAAHAPLIVAISGELGAGKTTLVRAICRGYGVTESVTSPTYALVHEYATARSPVYHIDLYRLENPTELTALAWDDIIASDALILVEWPERAGDRLPADHVPIGLEHVAGDDARRVLLAG